MKPVRQSALHDALVGGVDGALQEEPGHCLAVGRDDDLAQAVTADASASVVERLPPDPSSSPQSDESNTDIRPAAETSSAPNDPIEPAVIEALQDAMGSDFSALVQVFLDNTVELLAQLSAVQHDGAAERRHRAAHTLKSSSAQLGALGMSKMARVIEQAIREGELVDPVALDELVAEFERVRTRLTQLSASRDQTDSA